MICVAISDKNVDKCLSILNLVEMAEIRLDLTGFNTDGIKKVFSHPTPAIATFRPGNSGPLEQLQKLTIAIESGARYVDIEIEALPSQQQAIISLARKHQCKVIISYHNFQETPDLAILNSTVHDCFERGADIAKIAAFSHSVSDNAKIISLYSMDRPLVAIGMGDAGKVTRIMAPLLGAEFTFASMDDLEPTAPGQISYSLMKSILANLEQEINSEQ